MDASLITRLKELEAEILQEGDRGKALRPPRRREMAKEAVERRGISICLACEALFISWNCYRYEPKLSGENAKIADWLVRLTHNQKAWGVGRAFSSCAPSRGLLWNHRRVYWMYRELELNLRIKPKKCITRKAPEPLPVATAMKETWSMDFMHDSFECGRSYRLLKVIHGYNQTVRYDWLNQYLFRTIDQLREYATRWLWTYNHERPNMALGGIRPKKKLALVA